MFADLSERRSSGEGKKPKAADSKPVAEKLTKDAEPSEITVNTCQGPDSSEVKKAKNLTKTKSKVSILYFQIAILC